MPPLQIVQIHSIKQWLPLSQSLNTGFKADPPSSLPGDDIMAVQIGWQCLFCVSAVNPRIMNVRSLLIQT